MPHAERTITIARPQADVYAFFADAENDKRWRPGVTQIHREGPLAVGTRYTQRIAGPGGRQVPADVEITAHGRGNGQPGQGEGPAGVRRLEPGANGPAGAGAKDQLCLGDDELAVDQDVPDTR